MTEIDLSQGATQSLIILCGLIGIFIGAVAVWRMMKGKSEKVSALNNTITGLETKITTRDKQITQKQYENDTLAKNIKEFEIANADLKSELVGANNTIDKLQDGMPNVDGMKAHINSLLAKAAGEDFKVLKGVGASVETQIKEAGVENIYQLSLMSKDELSDVMDKAGLPKRLRKYDILSQAQTLVAELDES